jgi:hypothetical protein
VAIQSFEHSYRYSHHSVVSSFVKDSLSTMSRTSSTILEPRLVSQVSTSSDLIECSVHNLPKPLLREFRHVFGENYLRDLDSMEHDHWEILAIPTNQQAREDLVAVGDPIEFEKDRLLNVVRTWKDNRLADIFF